MSHNLDLSGLDRTAPVSLTQQLVDLIRAGVDRGDLAAGQRLEPTRALAERAGVNHLTAVRAYRRLAELGYVTAAVGRGTFVRQAPPGRRPLDRGDWQAAVLPARRPSYANEVLGQSFRMPGEPDMISLATGWPDPSLYPVADLARLMAEVFAEDGEQALSYLDPEGLPALREQIAVRGRAMGFATDAEEIVVTSGARQALDLVTRVLLRPGDVVAVEAPTFTGTLSSLQATGARLIGIPVDDDGLDIDALERVLARHEIKLCVLQSACQNPTGRDLSPTRAARLIELARERSFFLLDDGVYANVRFEGPERPRLRSLAPSHVIYVDSVSKTMGGGLRLGWIAADGPVRGRLVDLKLDSDFHSSSPIQHLAARFLASGAYESMLARTIPVYRDRRDALLESIDRRLAGEASYSFPLGGHHVWVTLERPTDEQLLLREALRRGVAFTPGQAMVPEESVRGQLRLSFSLLGPDALDEGVRRLTVALRQLRRDGGGARAAMAIS
ncbi:MAG: 2-aminoadipate transaminase [Solirubrobacteraceae bacterium]|jgi:DNA-binding transcriptional MocR family regulator|nr:2-aminoadipate transaminase [Solirubrobacteraceae bacterium]